MLLGGWPAKLWKKTIGVRRCRWTICFDRVADYPAILGLLKNLPADIREDAKRAYRIFQKNPGHPGLHFKKLEGEDHIYSARIGLEYRALAVLKGNRAVWYWIGGHAEYDRLI
jgi:hypothetical protein